MADQEDIHELRRRLALAEGLIAELRSEKRQRSQSVMDDHGISGTNVYQTAHVASLNSEEQSRAARPNEDRQGLSIEFGALASWDWDLSSGQVVWNDRHFLLQGYEVDEVTPSFEAWVARIHPDDRQQAIALVESARTNRSAFVHEFRSLHPSGRIVWCLARGWFLYDAQDQAVRMRGVMEDITARKNEEYERHYRLQLNETLRSLTTAADIQAAALDLLGRTLQADRVVYADADDSLVGETYVSAGTEDWIGRFPSSASAESANTLQAGQVVAVDDVRSGFYGQQAANDLLAAGIHAVLAVPLVKHERLLLTVSIHQQSPRRWREDEIALARETAERTWTALQRARTEEALRKSEEKYRDLFEGMREGFCIIQVIFEGEKAVDYVFVEVNPAFLHQTGIVHAVGRRMRDIAPDHEEHWFRNYGEVARTGQPMRFEAPAKHLGDRWYDVNAYRVGEPEQHRVAIIFTDITQRKKAEAALRDSEERHEFLLKLSDTLRPLRDVMQIQRAAMALLGERLAVNRAAFYQVTDDEVTFFVTASWEHGAPPPLPERMVITDFGEDMLEAYRGGRTIVARDTEQDIASDEIQMAVRPLQVRGWIGVPLVKEGRWFASIGVHSLRPRDWTPTEIRLVEDVAERTYDAIERARAEAALRESEERFRTMADNAPVLIWETDQNGATSVNRYYVNFFGVGLDELVGMGWAKFLHPDDAQGYIASYAEAFRQRTAYAYECRLRRADGQWRWLRSAGGPVGEDRFVGCSLDVTDLLNAQRATRESEERQAFLLKLSDTVRPLADPAEIQGETTRRLREQLKAGWCYYVDWDLERKIGRVLRDATREGLPSLVGDHDVSDVPEFLELLIVVGEVLTVSDCANYEQLSERIRKNFVSLGFRSMMVAPLVKDGHLLASLLVGDTEIRDWSPSEALLLVETAERTWAAVERGRVETALRKSEATLAADLANAERLRVLGERLVTEENFETIYEELLTATIAIARSDAGTVQIYDPETKSLELIATRNLSASVTDYFERVDASSMSACGIALRTGQRSVADYAADEENSGCLLLFHSGIQSAIALPLVSRTGEPLGMLNAHWREPMHRPTESEERFLDLIARQAADLIEQRRAQRVLRESEERFRQFADASAAGLWMRDAKTLEMDFTSPAVAAIYGAGVEALLGPVERWAALIVPDDRETAVRHLEEARQGMTVVHEFRIRRPSDGAFRWIRNTDFPLRDGEVIPRIGGIAEDVSEAKLAADHQAILLAELQHRVRNIMAMTRSVAQRTAKNARDVPDYASLISGRLMSLARTQALLTQAANVSVDLESLLHAELSAQAHDEGQYSLSGPQVAISPKAAEVLSLSIHELTTNALKYGAFSVAEGKIEVVWRVSVEQDGPVLRLQWTETRPAIANWTPPARRGFGSELVERRVPYELDGEGKVELTAEGARVTIAFPLQPGASILETSAPVRRSVYGGSIDMSGEQLLAGLRILVIEDDYLLAWDTQSALESAGATVVGPFKKEADALAAIQTGDLNAALTDINLGKGPSFEIANALSNARVPFAFLTGYDQEAIPEQFADVPRFVKPIDTRRVVRELSHFIHATSTEAIKE